MTASPGPAYLVEGTVAASQQIVSLLEGDSMGRSWPVLLVAVVACCLLTYAEDGKTEGVPATAKFPAKAGTYVQGEWTYVYGIRAKGSRSERRMGSLFFRGFPVEGHIGAVKDTPLGKFVYWTGSWCSGWLNTLTYDRPVFDPNGELLRDIKKHLNDIKAQEAHKPRNE